MGKLSESLRVHGNGVGLAVYSNEPLTAKALINAVIGLETRLEAAESKLARVREWAKSEVAYWSQQSSPIHTDAQDVLDILND